MIVIALYLPFAPYSLLENSSPDRSWTSRGAPRTICGGGGYSSTAECPYLPLEPLSDDEFYRIASGCPRRHGAPEAFEVNCLNNCVRLMPIEEKLARA